MKLYTEKQVRRLIEHYYDVNWTIYDEFDELTPIELPSDEEILQEAYSQRTMVFSFTDGAKWMRDTIKGGNK